MTDEQNTAPLREQLVREAEAAEAEWDREDAVPPVVRARAQASDPSQVYSVRIPVQQIERLRRLAEARGVKPTVLMREWVLERLAAEDLAVRAPEERLLMLISEVQRLAESVRSRVAIAADGPQPGTDVPDARRSVRLGARRRLASPLEAADLDDVLAGRSRQDTRPRKAKEKRP